MISHASTRNASELLPRVHGKAAETQDIYNTDRIANISILRVALLVLEAIDRHRKELHAIPEILIHIGNRRPVYIKVPLPKASDPVSYPVRARSLSRTSLKLFSTASA